MGPAHFGITFAAKPAAPKIPLLVLLAASVALDLLSFGFIALGIERAGQSRISLERGLQLEVPGSVPWSHGLFMALLWSLLFAVLAYLIYRDRRMSAIIGMVVFSHWGLDFIVHSADLPLLFEGSATVGLGLWASGPGFIASLVLEFALLAAGIAIYLLDRKRSLTGWAKGVVKDAN